MSKSPISIEISRIAKHFDVLGKIGNLGSNIEDGFLRASWSDEETKAMEYIRQYASEFGLSSHYDEIGNLFIGTDSGKSEVLQVGSHLDTVPRGGLFDGGAGIVAGLEALIEVKQVACDSLKKDLELVIWRGEESGTFGEVYKGSKAAFAILKPDSLAKTFLDTSLEDAIRAQGYDPDIIRKQRRTISQERVDQIAGHIELHIEQARKLEIDETDIGIVTSIRGNQRLRVLVHGESAHSGATPMGTTYRKDANLAIAHMQVRLHQACEKEIAQAKDLVQTVGVVNADKDLNQQYAQLHENGLTKVSAFGYFFLDVRSRSASFLEEYLAQVDQILRETAAEFGIEIEIQAISAAASVESLDENLQKIIEDSSNKLGYSSQRLASGAGHDAAIVAKQQKSNGDAVPTVMIFIPCRDGISHNPLEFTTNEAVTKGAEVIAESLLGIATI